MRTGPLPMGGAIRIISRFPSGLPLEGLAVHFDS